jgi:hypothetical protein
VPLNSLDAVAAELARVYRDARSGALPVADAGRLAFILVSLGRVLESAVIERRLTALEEHIDEQR